MQINLSLKVPVQFPGAVFEPNYQTLESDLDSVSDWYIAQAQPYNKKPSYERINKVTLLVNSMDGHIIGTTCHSKF